MPAINPLMYDDDSESEALSIPNPHPVTAPTRGLADQIFEATGTATANKVIAVWNDVKATAKAQVDTAYPGASELVEESAPKWATEPTKLRELDPSITSNAARVVGSLTADALTLPFGLPAAGYMATTTAGQETKQQLMAAGVDEGTADKAADVKMGETALGWGLNTIPGGRYISGMIPNAITRLGVKMGIGAGIVTGTDYIGGETRGAILEDAGYQKQADQVRQWDAWRIGADMLGGAMLAIGGSERPRTTEVLPDDVRASAQHIIETDHLIHDSAPGIPATPQASAFTSEATRTGIQQIENGQPVNIADVPGLEASEFLSPHAPAGHASSGPAVPAGSREAAAARKNIATYETALEELRADRDSAIKFIETARRDGYHEEADHFAENVLPGKNNIVSQYESLLDYARDDLHALENPQALSRAAEEIRPQLEEHAQAKADMNAYADTFESPLQEVTPATSATRRSLQDTLTEAREMLETARNPVQEPAAPTGEAAPKPPKLTPEDQQLVDMHNALREYAEATGDHDLHAELVNVMETHQAEHMEAGKFNVAALCAIGV